MSYVYIDKNKTMNWLSDLFGGGRVEKALRDGGVIVDIRTAYEYDLGHIPRSVNIPVDRIRGNIQRIKDFNKPVILCCDTGFHCEAAAGILRNAGISRVINGGDWRSVLRKTGR